MQAIALPALGETVRDGIRCNVTGWGDLVEDQQENFPTILQLVSLPTVNRVICKNAVGGITDSMICAGFVAGGRFFQYCK